MTTQSIYYFALVGHIIGLTMLAGTTLADYIMTKQFWKQYALEKSRGLAIQEAKSTFPLLARIGILVLIASGIGMMALTKGVFGEQVWFRIKFGIVIVIILNGVLIGRILGGKLKKYLAATIEGADVEPLLARVKSNMNLFHLSQITLFIIVFTLSVFKFN
jgi:hypothetical protein